MRLTKLGHSCVRLETGSTTVVVDPGGWSDPRALAGAQAVFVTHEHPDHVQPDQLTSAAADNARLEVWTNSSVAGQLPDVDDERVHVVRAGDTFRVGDLDVRVIGERHAEIHADIPVIENVGFLFDDAVFHPGDALTVPDVAVPTLLSPVMAPWMKVSELIEYLRAVAAPRTYFIHDGILTEPGIGLFEGLAQRLTEQPVSRLGNGEPVEISG